MALEEHIGELPFAYIPEKNVVIWETNGLTRTKYYLGPYTASEAFRVSRALEAWAKQKKTLGWVTIVPCYAFPAEVSK